MKDNKETYVSLAELANALHVSHSAIESYGSQKLISPRPDHPNSKVYSALDQIRLKLIVHAKNADYAVSKIRKLIGELDPTKDAVQQLDESMIYGKKNLQPNGRKLERPGYVRADQCDV